MNQRIAEGAEATAPTPANAELSIHDIWSTLAAHTKLLAAAPLLAAGLALGVSFLIPPTFTARTVFLPPQQPQSTAASALASLGALSGLAGSVAGIKSPADQYVALLQSLNVQDPIIDKFDLMKVYDEKYRFLTRKRLEENVRITLGKKDGLITIEADAKSPELAAELANQHVAELRRLSSQLVLSEAQQRRVFFETELNRSRQRLEDAQRKLQGGGFNPGALKAEPKAAADAYAKLKAQLTASEVKLQALRTMMADTAPEVRQQTVLISSLHEQLRRLESSDRDATGPDYIGNYREYKYQETLMELFARQYELARLDESREGASIQVIDVAKPPEYKSKPKRAIIAITVWLVALTALCVGLVVTRGRNRSTATLQPR